MSFDLERESLEAASRDAARLFVELYRGLERRRVDPGIDPDELVASFAGSIRDEGIGLAAAVEEFRQKVVPASMATAHPLYLGLVNCSPLPAGPLADLLVSALNNNSGAFGQGPAAMAAEIEILRAFSRLTYGDEDAGGMVLPGGSFANLQALLLARTRRFPEWNTRGPAAVDGRPRIYVSEMSHFSASRAAVVAGLGSDSVVSIPTIGRGALDPEALARHLETDVAEGAAPVAVVATAGTTGTGAIDPVDAIATLCRQHSTWLHVDACYGGAALLLEELRDRFAGIEKADSVALDPHKWFFCPLTVSLLLVRDPEIERETFDVRASYIPHRSSSDSFRRGVPTSRRASSLTLWMTLRAHGWSVVRDAVRSNNEMTRLLEEGLAEQGFSVLPGGELSIACARWEPEGWPENEIAALQERIAREFITSGKSWFATLRYQDKTWLRFNPVNIHLAKRHVRNLVQELGKYVREHGIR